MSWWADAMRDSGVHPIARGVAVLLGSAGAVIADDPFAMALAWLIALVPIFALSRTLNKHLRFVITFLLPLFLALTFVWGYLVGAPPSAPLGSDRLGGLNYAGVIITRLLLLVGLFQAAFLTLPDNQFVLTLRAWGLRGSTLAVVVSAFVLWPELRLRANQVLTARFARGLVPNRKPITRLKQLPYLIRPMLIWSFRSAIQRAELWQQRQLLERMARTAAPVPYSVWQSTLILLVAIVWLVTSVMLRLS